MLRSILTVGAAVIAVGVLSGCFCCKYGSCGAAKEAEKHAIQVARQRIHDNKAGCVIIKYGEIVHDENGRGISPILDIYRQHPDKMKNSVLVDKVIGKAAAMVAICGKVKYVHAELICDSAVEILEKHNIKVTYTLRVKNILNRSRTGLCPMEQTVLNISDPSAGVKALEAAVAKMKAVGRR